MLFERYRYDIVKQRKRNVLQTTTFETINLPKLRTKISSSGKELFAADADLMHRFKEEAAFEAISQRGGQGRLPYVGEGNRGRVVALVPGELYIKTTGPWTGRETYLEGRPTKKPSLVREMRFMEAARVLISSADPAITIPRTFATCTFPNLATSCTLIEALPPEATSISTLDLDDPEHYKYISQKLSKRVQRALGMGILRYCVSDISRNDYIHRGNVFMNPELDPDGEIYLIDLLGKRPLANTLSVLASTTTHLGLQPSIR